MKIQLMTKINAVYYESLKHPHMKRQATVISILAFILVFGALNWTACSKKVVTEAAPQPKSAEADALPAPKADPPFIAAIKEKIKGKENLPAEEVFENIQILKGIPAGRLLPIMQRGFSGSLGVKCNHCHEFGKWASDIKLEKQVARDMWNMQAKINGELLASIKNLKGPQSIVNCTTCHRGEAKPATSM
jgi:hypothetical protein